MLDRGLMQEKSSAPVSFAARSFGDYELLEEIARGGMGVVYKARQKSLNRIVAIKMVLAGKLANPSDLQRFKAEAETAARLQHPNIVAIHEVGEVEGLPFFSMDYVEGKSLAELAHNEPMPAKRAAAYLKTIAEAVEYAHSKGVLHRDLKPSNILIDQNDQPRVTDFGLAKRLADPQLSTLNPQLTLTGQVLGSPNFMPPEQAAAKHRELTRASDVYSLGALLYYLLAGRPPFLADSVPATLRMVAETEAVAPHLLNPTIPRDLETICLKCLEKEPQRRYATARELADELNLFLHDEPIRARPISASGRLWRWSRRNPRLAGTALAALLLFLAVVVGDPIAFIQINHARTQAEARQREATLEAIKSQQIAQFLEEMLRSAGPSVARGRDATLLRELLQKTGERVETELRNQPEVQGDMLLVLGRTYRDMGDVQQAISMLEKATAGYKHAFQGDHKKLALALGYLGQYQSFYSEGAAGKTNAQAGLEMARRCGDPETLAQCLLNVAESFLGWGMTSPDGLPFAREAAELYRKLGNNPIALADCLSFMAGATQGGDRADAERFAREALELTSKNLPPDHPKVAGDIFMLGQIQLDRGHFAEAELNLRETLRLFRKIHDEKHPHRPIVMRLLGEALTKQGKQAELEAAYREEVASFGEHPASSETVARFVAILQEHGKQSEAEPMLLEQLAKSKLNAGSNRAAVAEALIRISTLNTTNPIVLEAQQELLKDLQVSIRQALEQNSTDTNQVASLVSILGQIVSTFERGRKFAEAEPLLEQRLALQRKLYGNEHQDVLDSLGWMAAIRVRGGKPVAAAHVLQENIEIQTRLFGRENTNVVANIYWLANLYEDAGKWEQSAPLRQELLAMRTQRLGNDHPETIFALAKLCSLRVKQNKLAEAQILCDELISRASGSEATWSAVTEVLALTGAWNETASKWSGLTESKPETAILCRRRAEILGRNRQWEASMKALTRAIELKPDEHEFWHLLAPILVETGQQEQYRQDCRDSLEKFAATDDPVIAERIAKDCLILPGSGANLETVSKMTDVAVSVSPNHWAYPAFQFSKGFVEYRLGHFLSATEWMQKVLAAQGDWPRDVQAHLVLAMSDCQLGKKDEAHRALTQALAIQQAHEPKPESSDLGTRWNDWLIVHALMRETHALIDGTSSNPKDG